MMRTRSLALLGTLVAMVCVMLQPATASAAVAPRTWAVTLPGAPGDLSGLDTLQGELGAAPQTVMWYQAWAGGAAFPTTWAQNLLARGQTPEVTWEPWNPSDGTTQPLYTNARIGAGKFDSYLTSWAKAIRALGKPVLIRYAHEMNGTWYPWADGVNGNAAGSYVHAWNHVRAVFAKQNVTNVTWIWSPNVPYPGSVPLAQVFPGDAAVDEVALDGYNWADLQPGSTWTSFADVFSAGLQQLAALSTRPEIIGEVGCPEAGGDKAAWIDDMWTTLANWPAVRSVQWFDFDKEADWRIDSSDTSTAAFAAGLPGFVGP